MLADGKRLSVKSNKKGGNKIAPQDIGQATSETHFQKLNKIYEGKIVPSSYENKVRLCKETVIEKPESFLKEFFQKTLETNYLLYVSKCDTDNPILYLIDNSKIDFNVKFDNKKTTFTQKLENWNESNTVKYDGESIGEFQIHKNRNCFKFRWNFNTLKEKFINNDAIILTVQ